ncbi:hypothetical protein [Aquitalea aquatica]|uniref:Uncharacterized protein n=1 Tax=Aquitalea aquatica TaxID=3044273 RepID=A0A838XY13_9NEIS|nr:hypothetical protein [Aquitalea magnusonii]MBA4707543.1 hypothetical protein [Aquitalea magnusonii]
MSLSHLSAAVIQLMRQAELVRGYQRGQVELEFDGFNLVVRGNHTPPERPAAFHPGHSARFEVTEVFLADSATDAAELFDCRALEIAVLEYLKSQEKEQAA